jgi:hypothetical protein
MVTELISKPTTVRQQFEKIVESIEQEAVAAAETLGFGVKSKRDLLADLKSELNFWQATHHRWQPEVLPADSAVYTKPWDRIACLRLIQKLLEETLSSSGEIGVVQAFEEVDDCLTVLRAWLASAARISPHDHREPLART